MVGKMDATQADETVVEWADDWAVDWVERTADRTDVPTVLWMASRSRQGWVSV